MAPQALVLQEQLVPVALRILRRCFAVRSHWQAPLLPQPVMVLGVQLVQVVHQHVTKISVEACFGVACTHPRGSASLAVTTMPKCARQVARPHQL